MMKKVLKISLWVLLFSGFFTLLGFTTVNFKEKRCEGVSIEINNTQGYPLINELFIENYLSDSEYRLRGQLLSEIPIDEIEKRLEGLSHVKDAKVYTVLSGNLKIQLSQKQPIARVFNGNGSSFYIDDVGERMDLSSIHSARVIGITSEKELDLDDPDLEVQEQNSQLFDLIRIINKNEFWKSQMVQIHLDREGEIELTPRVGNHKILIGKATDLSSKFDKLWSFYQAISQQNSWSAYKVLNVKYKDQIVCTKK